MSDIAVSVEGLGKRYRISHQRDRYGRLTESLAGAVRAPFDRLRGTARDTSEWISALGRRLIRSPTWRSPRSGRSQRSRQDDAPEDPLANHRADLRHGGVARPRGVACSRSGPGSTPN